MANHAYGAGESRAANAGLVKTVGNGSAVRLQTS